MATTGRTTKEEASLPLSRYFDAGYFRDRQMLSFAQQIKLVAEHKPQTLLEIGKGNGFVADYLGRGGIEVTTLDINPALSPTVTGSILDCHSHFSEGQFDMVLCAEVLEHLPLTELDRCLEGIHYCTRKWAVITLPRAQRVLFDFAFRLGLPRLKPIETGLFLWWSRSRIEAEHHWELNSCPGSRFAAIRRQFAKRFTIKKEGRFQWNPYHHYFVLHK